jgi:acyl carrier protein
MHDIEQRLTKCFSAVFPELSPEDIVKVTSDGARNWDSLSWVTLLAVVEEEFGVELDADGMESSISFGGVLARVREAVRNRIPVESAHR